MLLTLTINIVLTKAKTLHKHLFYHQPLVYLIITKSSIQIQHSDCLLCVTLESGIKTSECNICVSINKLNTLLRNTKFTSTLLNILTVFNFNSRWMKAKTLHKQVFYHQPIVYWILTKPSIEILHLDCFLCLTLEKWNKDFWVQYLCFNK